MSQKKNKSKTNKIDWDVWKPQLIKVLITTLIVITTIILFLVTMGKTTEFSSAKDGGLNL